MFSGAGYSPHLRGAGLASSVVSPGAVRAQSHWRWSRDVSPASAAPCSSRGSGGGCRHCAFLRGSGNSASRHPEHESCQDTSPALPWPLAVFGASSSNTGEEHCVVLPNKRLNGAKGEETPLHKQRRGAFRPHGQPGAALAVLPWSELG